MSDKSAWRRSNPVVGVVLAVMIVFEVVSLASDLQGGPRYALSGAAADGTVLAVMQLSANSHHKTTGR
jgi:hypothetical protein